MKFAQSSASVSQQTIDMSNALCGLVRSIIEAEEQFGDIELSEPRNIPEPKFPARNMMKGVQRASYYRWRASTQTHSMSVRAADGVIEIFLMKVDDMPLLAFSEFGSRFKAKFELKRTADGYSWSVGNQLADSESSTTVLKKCLKDLVALDGNAGPVVEKNFAADASADSMQKLMLEKENLIFKVLNQQEILKNELARSLHDTVLADLLMLKRHLRGDQELSKEQILETIDEIAQQLRDICNECAPRNLHDWGLKTSLQDILQRMGQRTGLDCSLLCDVDIPNLPDSVELNIFRMMQECLNNVEKHAKAKKVTIRIERVDVKSIRFTVKDNGKGFEPNSSERSVDSGGMGVSGMRERVSLIRVFFPTEFKLESVPGEGTTIYLQITLPSLD
ncbi:MAG TPA: ATP-binding protein [Drouetiella sp.]